jgi:hypothetical protein
VSTDSTEAEVAVEPVFAPDVPAGVRRLYERRPELFVPADAPRPKRETSWSVAPGNTFGTLLVWIAVCVGGWILALIIMAAALPAEVAAWSELVLPEQLWDIAQVLREHTALRARQREVARGMATAELEAVLGPQRRALVLSVDAIKRKVDLLDRYADRVRSADAALRAEAALADGDRYIELLARTEPAGDTSVVQGFTDEAAALKETLTRTINAARDAGRTLAFPE